MFSHLKFAKSRAAAADVLTNNNRPMSPYCSANSITNNNNIIDCNGRRGNYEAGGGGLLLWSATASSLWNLLPSSILKTSSRKSSSKYGDDEVGVPGDRYYEQQRRHLIDKQQEQPLQNKRRGVKDIELKYLNQNHNYPAEGEDEDQDDEEVKPILQSSPPMSPSMFILPRCLEPQQCYSPVKLVAAVERVPRRIMFSAEDGMSVIEKFDKITINEDQIDGMTTSDRRGKSGNCATVAEKVREKGLSSNISHEVRNENKRRLWHVTRKGISN